MRIRRLTLLAALALLSLGAVALARSRASLSARALPALAGAAGHLSLDADLDPAVGGELESYEIDLARGFGFDGRGVTRVCSGRALRIDACPASSRVGSGSGRIAVQGRYLPRTEYGVSASFYLTPPARRGDLDGVLLDVDEPQSMLSIALRGRVLRLSRGSYGLALRFSNTRHELPSSFNLTLARLQVQLGSSVSTGGVYHSLLTNPRSCPAGGWPLAVLVDSAHRDRTFQTRSRCIRRAH